MRKLVICLLLLVTGLIITACQGGGGSSGSPAVTGVSNTVGTIVSGNVTGVDDVSNVPVFLIAADQTPVLPAGNVRADIAGAYYSTVTDAQGNFIFQNVEEGIYNVQAQKDRFQSALQVNLSVVRANTITVNLKLTATGDITGKLIVPSGSDPLGTIAFVAGTSYLAVADSGGNYKIAGIPSGTYTLSFSGKGFAVQTINQITVKGGQTTPVSDVTLSFGEAFNVVITGVNQLKSGAKSVFEAKVFGGAVGPFTYAWIASTGTYLTSNSQKTEWTAPTNATGVVNLDCIITDSRGATAKGTLPVEVLSTGNQAPQLEVRGPNQVGKGVTATYTAVAHDPDGDVVTYEWTTTGGTLSATNVQTPTWTAPTTPGSYNVGCTVSDGKLTDTKSIGVTVVNSTASPTRIVFNKFLGGSGVDEASSISRDSSGNFFVGGRTDSTDGDFSAASFTTYAGFNGFIAKLNSGGQTVWMKGICGDATEAIAKVRATSDGGCVFIGSTTGSGTGDIPPNTISGNAGANVMVGKLDASGALLWITLVGRVNAGTYANEVPNDVIIDSQGNIVVAWFSNWEGTVMVSKFKQDGTKLAESPVTTRNAHFYAAALTQGPDLHYIVTSNAGNSNQFQKFDRNTLAEMQTTTYSTTSGRVQPQSLAMVPNTGQVITVGGAENNAWDWYIRRVPINDFATAAWTVTAGGDKQDIARAIRFTPEGNFIVGGWCEDLHGSTQLNAWFRKYDQNGNVLWSSEWGGSSNDRAYEHVVLGNDGYVFAGHTSSADGDNTGKPNGANTDAWIMQIGY
ncbi:MAG: carboxypeptidase regulatory-like domain-containing protein [Candidatus Ozemobacteraceae bacterium]